MPKVVGNHSMIALCMISCTTLSVFRLWIEAVSCAACGNKSIRPLHCVRAYLRI